METNSELIKGYLIQNQRGEYLAKTYYWYEHDKPQEAWIHPEGKLENILTKSRGWLTKPALLTRAIYHPKSKRVTVASQSIRIQGLDIAQIKELLKKN